MKYLKNIINSTEVDKLGKLKRTLIYVGIIVAVLGVLLAVGCIIAFVIGLNLLNETKNWAAVVIPFIFILPSFIVVGIGLAFLQAGTTLAAGTAAGKMLKKRKAKKLESLESQNETVDIDITENKCKFCGEKSPADSKYCGNCGSPFEEE